MAYPGAFMSTDGEVLRAMQAAAANGGLIMMHAENGSVIDVLVEQALASGQTGPYYQAMTRPWQTEQEATHRSVMLAEITGAPLYIVHVAAMQALERIAQARDAGRNVFAETCPQFLYMSLEEQLSGPPDQAGTWVCSPPLRSRAEGHQEALWRYVATGDVTTVATDHCPYCTADKVGKSDFTKIANGFGTIEHRMDLIYQGVVDGRISLERWVDVCCTSPARMFGLYGRKGVIAPGADADIVVYDPAGHTSLGLGEGRIHHMNMDHSPWQGFEIDGRVDVVISRGTVVKDQSGFVGPAGHGQFLKRSLSQNLI
jgi:dihydropyrimidinase